MPSVRQRSWFGWLGLFALALQLVLSFGHHHERHEAQAVSALAAACEPGIVEPCRGGSHDHDDGDEHCAICWAVAAAARVVLPALFAFAIAADRVIALVPRAASLLVEHCPGRLFQARAPPSVAAA